MTLTIIFAISGTAILVLLLAKRLEIESGRSVFLFNAISRSDVHVREISHRLAHKYVEGKEKLNFFFKKQLSLKTRSFINRSRVQVQEKIREYIGDIRNSRLLRKNEGISEFLKNMSEVEKGNGQIDETFENSEEEVR